MAAVAGAGLALSVLNTIHTLFRSRVRLKVLPKSAVNVAIGAFKRSLTEYPPGATFCIEVINLSAFPVSIDEVGFSRVRTRARAAVPQPILHDKGGWPRRLEPHESVSAYVNIAELPLDISKAYATSQSGATRRGNSGALSALKKALKSRSIPG